MIDIITTLLTRTIVLSCQNDQWSVLSAVAVGSIEHIHGITCEPQNKEILCKGMNLVHWGRELRGIAFCLTKSCQMDLVHWRGEGGLRLFAPTSKLFDQSCPSLSINRNNSVVQIFIKKSRTKYLNSNFTSSSPGILTRIHGKIIRSFSKTFDTEIRKNLDLSKIYTFGMPSIVTNHRDSVLILN